MDFVLHLGEFAYLNQFEFEAFRTLIPGPVSDSLSVSGFLVAHTLEFAYGFHFQSTLPNLIR